MDSQSIKGEATHTAADDVEATDLIVAAPDATAFIVAKTRLGYPATVAGFKVRVATQAVKGVGTTLKGVLRVQQDSGASPAGPVVSSELTLFDFSGAGPDYAPAVGTILALLSNAIHAVIPTGASIELIYVETGDAGTTPTRPEVQLLMWSLPERKDGEQPVFSL